MSKKTPTTPTPHDGAFRAFLSSPEVARDFVSLHLPAEYRGLCDLSTLKIEPCSFVDEELKKYECDALFSMKTPDGEDGYVYCLAEHQSSDNPFMAFRMLRYSVAAMQRHFEQHKRLPLVIPILFYHGERSPYPHSMGWMDCFDKPEIVAKIFTSPFHLVDLTVTDDDEFMHHRRMGALSLMMKHIRSRDLMMQLDRLATLIRETLDERLTLILVNYLLNGSEHVTVEFLQTLAQRLPQHEDSIMTLAERLKQEGIQKGRMEGRMEGRLEEKQDIARQLQKMGMTPEQIKLATGLSDDDLKKITH
ncbi:Rpn family recombination-promoting nuclease/putative transposase [Escherichia coli]|uniref:Rpn family recombination-promoting nuclease/putative transposase n=1 Tax=Escherichia coli TaxID=562 RepID=A0ABD4PKH9_ECOLX|nr:Rpn family recombination-promoting nuclease/putative transposase [Escherichia coli]EBY0567846.1 Rpn family recombination-promoting nuclease/putative transposase [Salmonella enterica subsp. enterica serovar Java]EEC7247586.1 Rpn family recombination-promoting nuclease/putative transposase [Escherichia coli]EEQ5324547.1 Rpn family recombination-promoting nuclease/putative transposase [Escherichia coli]EEQ8775940.1 Rpn family recombination-promoting nuclease/putative transposase [Escherichia co